MNSESRRLLSEFVIAVAVCGGAYCFLVDGTHGRIAAVRADIVKVQQDETSRTGIASWSDAQVSDLLRTTAERAQEMRTKSAPAGDEATMFAQLSELGKTFGVRVEQLNPAQGSGGGQQVALPAGVQPGTPAAAALAAPADGPPPARDLRVGCSMSITGRYADIAGFVGALTDRLGYTIVKSVRLSQPDMRSSEMLRASIETEHVAIDLSAVKVPPVVAATRNPMPVEDKSPVPGKQAAHEVKP